MRVWTNTTFKGLWPVGTSAVVVAPSARVAAELLNAELLARSLPQDEPVKAKDMKEVDTSTRQVIVLQFGNY